MVETKGVGREGKHWIGIGGHAYIYERGMISEVTGTYFVYI